MRNIQKSYLFTSLLLVFALSSFAQNVTLEAYVFEDNNRGYLNEVYVTITDISGEIKYCETNSNLEGFFTCELPVGQDYILTAKKDVFEDYSENITTKGKKAGEKIYQKIKMQRQEGYLFDVTLAEETLEGMDEVDAIQGALIEIYNNTEKKESLVLKDHPFPTFQHTLRKGNHYTIMIRKEGFFTKRIEAYVDIDGCILCMDGVSEIAPGVSDNLTEGNEMGTLLANIELQRAELNKSIEIKNIYYDFNSAVIKKTAEKELDKVIYLMKNNPAMIIELGSHTDARGKNTYNQSLSQRRAESAVKYIVDIGEIDEKRILAKGYGETQLVNNCKDGVNCSDEKHQENRRTELKIVGYKEEEKEMQSLAQIIEAEQFEIMLQEVLNQEVVEIKEGEEIPEDLKKGLEEQGKKQTGEIEEEAPASKDSSKINPQSENQIPENITTKAEEQPVRVPIKEQELNPPASTTEEEPSEKISELDPFASEEEKGAIIGEVKIETQVIDQLSSVDADYTGFMVEIEKSFEAISSDHVIFTQHGNIKLDIGRNDIHSYMIGDFKVYEKAYDYLKKNLMVRYPRAKIIQYENGNRVDF